MTKLELGKYGFDQVVGIIKQCSRSGSALDEIEDLVKAGLRKYLHHRVDKLEMGLRITKAERFTSETERPDFVAVDRNGKIVLIECKGVGHARDCEQMEKYRKRYSGDKDPRLMLVAFEHDLSCRKEARPRSIELVECNLAFERV